MLLDKYRTAEAWNEWDQNTRIAFLKDLADFGLKLDTIRGATNEQLPENFGDILVAWLGGSRSIDIAQTLAVNASHMAKVIEAFCVYSLPWAANSFFGHLHPTAEASGIPLPTVCSYFSSMYKYGLSDPLAALFSPYLDGNRRLSASVSKVSPYSVEQPDRALAWLHDVSVSQMIELGIGIEDASNIADVRRQRDQSILGSSLDSSERYKFIFSKLISPNLASGDRILIRPAYSSPTTIFFVYTARGENLGSYDLQSEMPNWWHELDQIDAEVEEVSHVSENEVSITIILRRIR